MKTIIQYIQYSLVMLCMVLIPVACTNDVPNPGDQQGEFVLGIAAADIHVDIQTKAAIQGVDVSKFYVSLDEAEGTHLIVSKQYGTMTSADCILPVANGYRLSVESCSEADATTLNNGFGAYRFAGEATFNIAANEKTSVAVNCEMLNAGLQIEFDQSFTTKFPIHAVTTQDARAIVFNSKNQENIAYYDINGDNLEMAVKITGSTGGWDGRLDATKNITLQKGKVIVVKLTYTESNGVRMLNV